MIPSKVTYQRETLHIWPRRQFPETAQLEAGPRVRLSEFPDLEHTQPDALPDDRKRVHSNKELLPSSSY